MTLALAISSGALGMNFLSGPAFDISWFTMDGGGGLSTGGTFDLQGVIGQPDAGGMRGGIFELAGGWLSTPPPPSLTFPVDPRGSYLHMFPNTGVGPVIIELASVGLFPGDLIQIENLGGYVYVNGGADGPGTMTAVFSSDDSLLAASETYRVPGAIEAGADYFTSPTYNGSQQTDIPEDFLVGTSAGPMQVCIEIPIGATHLFCSAADTYYSDNSDPNGDFAVRLSLLICKTDCEISADGTTDVLDLLDLLAQWGQPGPCDIDCNDIVDVEDLLSLLAAWGACP
ncbi:MAG: hypothetical protein O7G85_03990 [Planctomycetota bacterium]|nr:hypothetical protein [Planctomycetota bacterium]